MIGVWHCFFFEIHDFLRFFDASLHAWLPDLIVFPTGYYYLEFREKCDRMGSLASSRESQALEEKFAGVGDNMNQKRSMRCEAFNIMMTMMAISMMMYDDDCVF